MTCHDAIAAFVGALGRQGIAPVVLALVGILALVVAILTFSRRPFQGTPKYRRKNTLALIQEHLSLSASERDSIAERARLLALKIRLEQEVHKVLQAVCAQLCSLHMPGAERLLELQAQLRDVARGEDMEVLKYLERIKIYEEMLLRCEAAARERRDSDLIVGLEALRCAASKLANRPRPAFSMLSIRQATRVPVRDRRVSLSLAHARLHAFPEHHRGESTLPCVFHDAVGVAFS